MSDPVTNVELDDVLSSIRRLVADREPVRTAARPTEPPAAAEAFLLTPALRVETPEPPPRAPTLLFPANMTHPVPLRDTVAEAGLVARLAAKLEAAVTAEAGFEPDGSEDDPVIDWSAPMLGEPPVFRSRQTPVSSPAAGPVKLILPLAEAEDDAPLRDAIEAAAPVQAPVLPEPTFHHRSADAVTAPAPDDDDDTAGDDLSVNLARSSRDLRGGEAAPQMLALADGQLLDEEMLRTIITEIVRQELQGTLGERITRNVRKLVRREIFKVLSSQDLE